MKESSKINNKEILSNSCRNGTALLDLEQTIAHSFNMYISEHLFQNEIAAMTNSNELIDQLQTSKIQKIEKQQQITNQQSVIEKQKIISNTDIENSKLLLRRKSPQSLPPLSQLQHCLHEIKQKCSNQTHKIICKLIQDSKNMKKTIIKLQSIQKVDKRKMQYFQSCEQSLFVKNHLNKSKDYQLENFKNQIEDVKQFFNLKQKIYLNHVEKQINRVRELCAVKIGSRKI